MMHIYPVLKQFAKWRAEYKDQINSIDGLSDSLINITENSKKDLMVVDDFMAEQFKLIWDKTDSVEHQCMMINPLTDNIYQPGDKISKTEFQNIMEYTLIQHQQDHLDRNRQNLGYVVIHGEGKLSLQVADELMHSTDVYRVRESDELTLFADRDETVSMPRKTTLELIVNANSVEGNIVHPGEITANDYINIELNVPLTVEVVEGKVEYSNNMVRRKDGNYTPHDIYANKKIILDCPGEIKITYNPTELSAIDDL